MQRIRVRCSIAQHSAAMLSMMKSSSEGAKELAQNGTVLLSVCSELSGLKRSSEGEMYRSKVQRSSAHQVGVTYLRGRIKLAHTVQKLRCSSCWAYKQFRKLGDWMARCVGIIILYGIQYYSTSILMMTK